MFIIDKITGGNGARGGDDSWVFFAPSGDHKAPDGDNASNVLSWSPILDSSYMLKTDTTVKNSAKEAIVMTLGGHYNMSGTGNYTSAGGGGGGAVCAGRYSKADDSERIKGRDLRGYGGGGYGSSSESAEVHNGG